MIRFAKFLLRCLLKLLYGVKVEGMEHYNDAGKRVVIVANHTSLLDSALLYAWLPETPTFAINTWISTRTIFKPFMKLVDLFVLDPTNPLSVKSMIKFIKTDRKVVIFPEGRITVTGTLMKIYEGPGLIADKADAMILPIAIDGTQFSPSSYMRGRRRIFWFPRIRMRILAPQKLAIAPTIQGHARRKAATLAMQALMFKLFCATYDYNQSIFGAILQAADCYGKDQQCLEDINREPLNYGQLISRAFILARLFRKDTVRHEHVGLLLPNVNTTVISFLALQYLGRVTAMLNYSAGTQAVLRACETGNIKTVYTSKRFIENAGLDELASELEKQVNLVYLEELRSRLSIVDKLLGVIRSYYPHIHYRQQTPDVDPDSPAVILFTSGSEGTPKGVVLSHKNILSNFAQVRCHIDFNSTDISFSCLPLFHSFGLIGGTLMPLLGGSKVFLYPTPLHYRIIPELIYALGATILFGTNTFFKGYAHHAHGFDFQSLRYCVAGAEKLRADTQRLWMEKFGIRIYEGYGVTETSPVISVNTPVVYKPDRVGQLLPDMECYIKPVEGISEGGRLVVKGPNVMLGYLLHGNDGKIEAPMTERGIGWYDTGDIVAIDEEGFISILGRAKRFAKIGGEMVSLAAVEELAMQTWPDFNHAAVTLPDEKKGEKIVLVTDNEEAHRKQIQLMSQQLKYGELYIPKKVVLIEEMPLLGTGKTNYILLTEMALAEDKEGSGWIKKITSLMQKTEKLEPPAEAEDASPAITDDTAQ